MKFEIDFNSFTEKDDKVLEELGAKLVPTGSNKYPPFEKYEIEINTFEELEKILEKVNMIKKDYYSAVIGFDPATIYLDNKV